MEASNVDTVKESVKIKPGVIVAGILALLLLIVYMTGVYFFQDKFPFQTYYRGHNISEQTVSVISDIDAEEAGNRAFTVTGRGDVRATYNLTDWIGYTEKAQTPSDGWLPSPWLWPIMSIKGENISCKLDKSFDEDMLKAAAEDVFYLHEDNPIPVEDAYIDKSVIPYKIVSEVEGNELDWPVVYAYVVSGLKNAVMETDGNISLDLDSCGAYIEPRIRDTDEHLNLLYNNYLVIGCQTITIDLVGEVIELTPDSLLRFYTRDDEGAVQELDESVVANYISGLKEAYDTYEKETEFINHNGDTIYVGTWRDTYGFKMDADATTALLLDALRSKESTALEPVWINKANARAENGSDVGDTYIEISISEQHLWAYIDGECVVSTDVVTGNAGNHDSPKGEFYIMWFERNATLKGADYSSFVNFWMPITSSGVGLHDASWRSSYGGSIYKGNGSHGCINMPYWAASDIYWSFTSGTPVVIY